MLNWYFKTLFKSFSFEIAHKIALRCPCFCDLQRFRALVPDYNWAWRDSIVQSFLKLSHCAKYLQSSVILWSSDLITNRSGEFWLFKVKTCQPFFFKLSHAANDLVIFCDLVLWLHLDLSIIGKKSCAKMKTWSIVHHRQLQSAFSAAMSLVQRWGSAGDHPGIDEGGNYKRARFLS